MKPDFMLIITSLLSIFLMTLHLTSDTIHARVGTPKAGGSTLVGVPVLVLWLVRNVAARPNGGRGTSSCSSGRSLRRACPSSM
jgi:hypothetical protein